MPETNLKRYFLPSIILHVLFGVFVFFFFDRPQHIEPLRITVVNYLPKNISVDPRSNFFGLNVSAPKVKKNNVNLRTNQKNEVIVPLPNINLSVSDTVKTPKTDALPDQAIVLNRPTAKDNILSGHSFESTFGENAQPSLISGEDTPRAFGEETSEKNEGDSVDEYVNLTVVEKIQYKKDRIAYANYLKNRINKNWRILKIGASSFEVLYRITIDHSGKILKIQKLKGTHKILLENSIEQSIKISSPFKPLPDSFPVGKNYRVVVRFLPNELK